MSDEYLKAMDQAFDAPVPIPVDADTSRAMAERILEQAGWSADPGWGGFTYGTCVGGLAPDGNVYVKNWAAIPPGDPRYSPDTPDEPHEAAAWLAARYKGEAPVTADGEPATLWEDAPPISDAEAEAIAETVALFDDGGEAEQDLGRETHGETGAAAEAETDRDVGLSSPGDSSSGSHASDDETLGAGVASDAYADPLDADFTDLEIPDELDEPDFGAEMLEAGADLPAIEGAEAPDAQVDPETGAQFIFGDNLEQMRTAAIGLVIRHARTLMPYWTTDEDAALRELRNYTMGVQVNGWPDDPARRAELDGLEATRRRINEIVASRDEKVEFLEGATRDEVEAFDVEAGWP